MNNMTYARINAAGTLETTAANTEKMQEILAKDGFLPYTTTEQPTTELEPLQSWQSSYDMICDEIIQVWRVVDNDPKLIAAKIGELTIELDATDYKVIKNQEYIAAGEEPYYNVQELHQEREAIRTVIRSLESM